MLARADDGRRACDVRAVPSPADYVHRAGRVGRVGQLARGTVTSVLCAAEVPELLELGLGLVRVQKRGEAAGAAAAEEDLARIGEAVPLGDCLKQKAEDTPASASAATSKPAAPSPNPEALNAEIDALLGRVTTPNDREADFEAFVLEHGEAREEELMQLFQKRCLRHEALYEPAARERPPTRPPQP